MSDTYWENKLRAALPRRRFLSLLAAAGAGGALIACTGDDKDEPAAGDGASSSGDSENTDRPAGWTTASHSNDADPDYDIVFPIDKVNAITITVSPENWQVMLDDMTQLFGARGTNRGGGGAQGGAPGGGFGAPPGGGGAGPGAGDFTSENPVWVPGTIGFNGKTWTNVGVRFKGNSSLRSSWGNGTDKLPFKLDFDEFENDYPEIDNQRFYGFKQLSMGNNFGDATGMRERVAYDTFEAAGLVAAKTGFYDVTLDYGQGAQALGLYTVIEVVDDTVIERSFKDGSGNIYEAEGSAASLAAGVIDRIPASFQVESDETKADWADIKALYNALHSTQRTTEPAVWRRQLEKIFDVDGFLEWMAISAVLQHWDTYGGMTHNFYLYNDTSTGKIVWVTWDHNLVLGAMGGGGGGAGNVPAGNVPQGNFPQGGGPGGGGQDGMAGRMNVGFDKSAVTATSWPLIAFLWEQPEYRAKYHAHLKTTIETAFEPSKVTARIDAIAKALSPVAAKTSSADTYATAVAALTTTVQSRVQAAKDYLATL